MKPRTHLALGLMALLFAAPLLGAAAPVVTPAPVAQAAAASTADIRDIHGPIWIPAWWRPWLFGLALLGAGGVALAVGRRLRRRKPLTAAERALGRLDEAAPLALPPATKAGQCSWCRTTVRGSRRRICRASGRASSEAMPAAANQASVWG
jgi:hypothetical protein